MLCLTTYLSEYGPTLEQPKPMFTVYRSEEKIELRSGRDESREGQIYCSSLLYESALKISQILSSQHQLPLKNFVQQSSSLTGETSQNRELESRIGQF